MVLNYSELEKLTQLAVQAAYAAGEIITEYSQRNVSINYKNTHSSTAGQVVTEVDHKAQAAILEILLPSCEQYNLALLSEELPDDNERQVKPAFWCIDPMDGTLAFTQNNAGYAVSIALVARDGAPLIGVVFDPVEQVLYQSIAGYGVFRKISDEEMQPLAVAQIDKTKPLILRTDFSFKSHPWFNETLIELKVMAEALGFNGAEIKYRNGAVLNACTILESPNICYFKYPRLDNSGGSLWDYAASACIYSEAGAVASDIYGGAMELNRVDSTFMNHRGIIFSANLEIAESIMALFQKLERLSV